MPDITLLAVRLAEAVDTAFVPQSLAEDLRCQCPSVHSLRYFFQPFHGPGWYLTTTCPVATRQAVLRASHSLCAQCRIPCFGSSALPALVAGARTPATGNYNRVCACVGSSLAFRIRGTQNNLLASLGDLSSQGYKNLRLLEADATSRLSYGPKQHRSDQHRCPS